MPIWPTKTDLTSLVLAIVLCSKLHGHLQQLQSTAININAFGQQWNQQQQRLSPCYFNAIICGIFLPQVYLNQLYMHVDILHVSILITTLGYTLYKLSVSHDPKMSKQLNRVNKILKSLLLIISPFVVYLLAHIFFLIVRLPLQTHSDLITKNTE